VTPHDKAIEYARTRKFSVTQALGVVEVADDAARERIQPALEEAAAAIREDPERQPPLLSLPDTRF
jgi:hypothetical protein